MSVGNPWDTKTNIEIMNWFQDEWIISEFGISRFKLKCFRALKKLKEKNERHGKK